MGQRDDARRAAERFENDALSRFQRMMEELTPSAPEPAPAAIEPATPARWVYFIRCDITGLVKIGTSFDPATRLRTLQCGSPTPLRIERQVVGYLLTEAALHERFAAQRRHGEWFSIGADEVAAVDEEPSLAALLAETESELRSTDYDEQWLYRMRAMWGDALADRLVGYLRGTKAKTASASRHEIEPNCAE
jgi:hypothetical protein